MKVYHEYVRYIETPLEQLRFDPDPLDINEKVYPRRVVPDRVEKAIAEMSDAQLEDLNLSGETPALLDVCPPASLPSVQAPSATEYDVGHLERKAKAQFIAEQREREIERELLDNPFDVPRWLLAFIEISGVCFGFCVGWFVRIFVVRRRRGKEQC